METYITLQYNASIICVYVLHPSKDLVSHLNIILRFAILKISAQKAWGEKKSLCLEPRTISLIPLLYELSTVPMAQHNFQIYFFL